MIRPFQKKIAFEVHIMDEQSNKIHYELWLNTSIYGKPYFSMLHSLDNDLSKHVVMYYETNLSKAIKKFEDASGYKIPYSILLYISCRYTLMMVEYRFHLKHAEMFK